MRALTSLVFLVASCSRPKSNGTDFTWSGTAPLSVDIDGHHFQATTSLVANVSGAIELFGSNSSDTTVTITFTGVPAVDAIYNTPSPANLGMEIKTTTNDFFTASSGQVKVLSLVGTTIEGDFYGTVKDSMGVSHTYKNGYFKMTQ